MRRTTAYISRRLTQSEGGILMQEEIELEIRKKYIVPLSDGRKLLIERLPEEPYLGASISLIDKNGDIEDLLLAEEYNQPFGNSALQLYMWSDIFNEFWTDKCRIKKSDIVDMEKANK